MTVRYDSYIEALQSGVIDLNNVSLSVIVVSKYYKPQATDTLQNVTGKIAAFENLFVGDELKELSMSDIMDRISAYCKTYKSEKNIELSEIAGFVTYKKDAIIPIPESDEVEIKDVLCFYEDLKINEQ